MREEKGLVERQEGGLGRGFIKWKGRRKWFPRRTWCTWGYGIKVAVDCR